MGRAAGRGAPEQRSGERWSVGVGDRWLICSRARGDFIAHGCAISASISARAKLSHWCRWSSARGDWCGGCACSPPRTDARSSISAQRKQVDERSPPLRCPFPGRSKLLRLVARWKLAARPGCADSGPGRPRQSKPTGVRGPSSAASRCRLDRSGCLQARRRVAR